MEEANTDWVVTSVARTIEKIPMGIRVVPTFPPIVILPFLAFNVRLLAPVTAWLNVILAVPVLLEQSDLQKRCLLHLS
jgi:hypothetical protein